MCHTARRPTFVIILTAPCIEYLPCPSLCARHFACVITDSHRSFASYETPFTNEEIEAQQDQESYNHTAESVQFQRPLTSHCTVQPAAVQPGREKKNHKKSAVSRTILRIQKAIIQSNAPTTVLPLNQTISPSKVVTDLKLFGPWA